MIQNHEMLVNVNPLSFLRVAGDAADRVTIGHRTLGDDEREWRDDRAKEQGAHELREWR